MGLMDAFGRVSSAQQVTATGVSTHTIDLSNVTPKRQIGTCEPVGFAVFISANGTTTGSLALEIIQSAAADLSAPTVIASRNLVTAQLSAGNAHFIGMPPGMPTQRYIGLRYTVTGTVDFTGDAYLVPQSFVQSWTAYAKGYVVS